ncbi:MAG: tandem-95 repeat protein [Sterolibacteriaceae bacterium]|uniref:Tandem-95 repeat protein n=1 Tax=Candidatus Methylophosphatis roskildensis TaxID=2899263 RepID=A0A9D7HRE0_9PROT|nr:tandem-95 repeat protein [Candidatus Methylophosphatis roskildensis]
MRKPAFFRRKPILEELEPRILYSADAQTALLGADDFFHQAEVRTLEPTASPSASTSVQFEAAEQRSHELVFIDKRVDDYQLLVDDLLSHNDGSRQVEIFLLDPNRDGVEQISQVLAQRHDIGAVHLISHGADGNVELGSGKLNFDTLIKQAAQIKAWGDALTDDADLLIYGCDVAATPDGQAMLNALSNLTGADVAASDDLTGSAKLGGDWTFEYHNGSIETQTIVLSPTQEKWFGVLNSASLNPTGDTYIMFKSPNDANNFGTSSNLIVDRETTDVQRALFQFDLSSIPIGSTITGATLKLQSTQIGGTLNISVYEVTQAWSEGTGSGTAGAANWTQRQSGTNWTTAGGTFNSTAVATLNTNVTGQHTWDITSLVQAWFNGTKTNSGLMVASPDTGGNRTATYDSREGTTPPVLQISFTPPTSTAPVISGLAGDSQAYTTGSGAVIIDQGGSVSIIDGDSPDFNTGTLTVSFAAGSDPAEDVLSIRNQGTGAGQMGLSGANVTYGGTTIGTYTGGSSGTPLVITLNANANTTNTAALIQNVSYQNTDAVSPTGGARTVRFVLSDGDGGTSANYDATVGISGTYVVTNTNDSGAGSLRQAILNANANPAADTITFNIAGTGVHTITPATALPTITGQVTIDATTDDSFAANGSRPAVILDGNNLAAPGLELTSSADGSTIRGFVIRDFAGDGIAINIGSDGNTIVGNYIGSLLADGSTAGVGEANANAGIYVEGANNTIGGLTAADRNVISGNADGVLLSGASATGNLVVGNYIGTNAAGSSAIGNATDGVAIQSGASSNTVGGSVVGARNIISGNLDDGVDVKDGTSRFNVVRGNYIGTDVTGTLALGNTSQGIDTSASAQDLTIGGINPGDGNLVAFNGGSGVRVFGSATTGVSVLGNTVRANSGIGINLHTDGVTLNDSGDTDTGPNGYQNFPVLSSADANATGTTVVGTLNSNTGTSYRIEFYANRPSLADGTGYGEGERYLGFTTVTTNGSGNASFNTTLAGAWVNRGDKITATATVDLGGGNYGSTSEFGANITATSTGIIVVDTTSDVADGTTTSITNLGNNRGADGRISLREAIIAANNTANGGTPDKIVFAIPAALSGGVHTINVGVAGLPTVTQAVIIDGTTEPDFAGTPMVELNGGNLGSLVKGITLGGNSSGSTIRGLIINRFTGTGIEINGGATSNNHTIQGNWIGLNATGTAAAANGNMGIYGLNSTGNLIGGATAAQRNVISGNAQQGVFFDNVDNSTISGNYIGTNAAGTGDVTGTGANTLQSGVFLHNGSNGNVVGGTSAVARNVISGNNHYGVEILTSSQNNLVQGNYIGTDVTGLVALGNTNGGMSFWGAGTGNVIGGGAAGAGNVIAANGTGVLVGSASSGATIQGNYIGVAADGVTLMGNTAIGVDIQGNSINTLVGSDNNGTNDAGERNVIAGNSVGVSVADASTTGNAILSNSIYGNTGLGIDLGTTGVTANDTGDGDTGPNRLQNFPVMTTARTDGSTQLMITGSLNSTANSYYRIEFFANASQDGTGHGEGQRYLGFANAMTDGSGNATINATISATVGVGEFISATATKSDNTYSTFTDTSEFAQNVVATAPNAAPVLDPAYDLVANPQIEDAGAPVGNVGQGFGADFAAYPGITDADAGDPRGVAIVAADQTHGTWWYSVNLGATWQTLGAVSNTSARLLGANTGALVYFQPDPDYNGTLPAAVTIRAWDQTSGVNGGLADTSVNGSSTAFSSATDTLSFEVTAVNDAPVLSVASSLNPQTEDVFNSIGTLVSTLASGATDVDAGALKGLAITGVDNSHGTWQYTLDGTNWLDIGNVSITSARLLPSDALARIRFVPNADWNGNTGLTMYKAWDQTSGTAGGLADASVNGGSTAFSFGTSGTALTVSAVNDAPTALAGSVVLASVPEDSSNPAGATASSLFAGVFSDAADQVTGGSSANAFAGVAVVANAANGSTQGSWQWFDGGSWVNVGTSVSTSSALTLAPTTLLRFLPVADYNGSPGALGVRLIDSSGGAVTSGATLAVGSGGGSSRFSSAANQVSLGTSITAVNDAPAVTTSGGALAYTENQAASAIDAGLTVSDIDSTNLSGATVTISANYVNGQDVLGFTDQLGITGNWNAGAGILTLTGTTTVANYQTALRSVSYANTSDDPSVLARTISVVVSDGGLPSSAATRDIAVSAVNDPPVVFAPAAIAVIEDLPSPIAGIVVYDVDAGGGSVTATFTVSSGTLSASSGGGVVVGGSASALTLTGSISNLNAFIGANSLSFTTALDDTSAVTLGVSLNDAGNSGSGGPLSSGVTNVTLNVTPVDDTAPVANADAISVAEGGTATTLVGGATSVMANDGGLSDTPVNVSVVSGPAHASAFTLNADGSFSYTHDGSENFSDSFSYQLTDNDGQTSTATVSITISPVSDATPVANADAIAVAEGGTATSLVGGATNVKTNDTGLSDTPVNVSLVTDVSHGSLTLNADGPPVSWFSASHRLTDNDGETSTATVSITITPVSDTTPVANADAISVAEGGTATSLVGGATNVKTARDPGPGPARHRPVTARAHGSLTSTPTAPSAVHGYGSENFSDSFSYRLTDNDGETSTATVSITITPVSDTTPVANADAISVAEGGTATSLLGGATNVKTNDTGLTDTPVNVSLVTDVAHGTLTLNADGSFSYTHDGSENFSDSFSYRLTDNDGQSSTATVSITISPVSDTTPVANADAIAVAEGGTATSLVGGATNVKTNDTGLTDTPVNVSLVTDVAHGSLTLNADGTFSYTHDGSENFSDSFSYRLTDNDGQSSDATVSITISPVSDTTPVASDDAISVAEGGTATSLVGGATSVMANDSGLSDTPVNVSLVTDVAHGSLTLNADGTFSYTHDGSENFSDSFSYRLTDNDGQSSDATVSITISPVSDTTPVASDDAISVAEGGTATSLVGGATSVMANDSGLTDTPVNVSLVTDVAHGSLTLNADGTFSYVHDGSENFSDSFSYRLTDNDGQTSTATVSITISPVSDTTPVASDDAISVAEGGTATTLVGGAANVKTNDTGLADSPVNVSLVTDVAHGTLTLNADGTFSYTHDGSENFSDSFSYRLTDNDGQTSTATVNITITPVSDTTPVASDDAISVAEGGTATTLVGGATNVKTNDTGLADSPVNVSLVSDVSHGTLTLNADGSFSYTHDGSENFSDSFSYRLTDNDGQTSTATVSITISPVSDTTPVASDDAIAVAEGGTATSLVGGATNVMANDGGLSDTPVNVSLVTNVTHGTLTLNADGSFSYTHDGSENFSDSFSYRLTDNDGQTSTATVSITISPVSDTTPVAFDDAISVAEGGTATTLVGGATSVMANDGGLSDTPVNVSVVSGPAHASAFTLNADGSFSYTHDGSENFSDSFSYQLTDNDGQTSTATVSITISPVSDATPVANADAIAVAEGGTATSLVGGATNVKTNDTGLSDTPVNVSLVTDVSHGSLTLNADGTFSYVHDGSENFSDSFSYRLTDNDGETSTATVSITITPVSDTTPVANADAISVAEGGTATSLLGGATNVKTNDTGLADSPVNVSLVSDVSHGTLTLNADGTFSYTHDGSENFSDSFSYRLTDNDGQTSTATVSITITPVSDTTPVANADAISVAEGGTATSLVGGATNVKTNDTGLADSPVNVSLVSDVSHGTLTLNADGTFSYLHDGSENFSDSFSYRLTDNDGQTSDATVSITISPVSDTTPVAFDDAISVAEGGTATSLVGGATNVKTNDTGLTDTPVNVSLVTDVAHGTLTLNADGSFSYTHDGSENFSDSFSYRLTDNDGQSSTATVSITISPVSDTTPVANADAIAVAEGGTATSLVGGAASVMANDTGLSDTPVNVSLVTDVSHGSLTLNADGSFSYTHDGSENFSDSFSYRLTDNDGQTSTATVSITISPVSDTTPAANADAISVAEGGTATTLVGGATNVKTNDTGLSDTPVNVSVVSGPAHASAFTLNADGSFSYTHDGSENFSDSFSYQLTDNDGQSSTATVSITISPVSDTTPVASDDAISVAEGGTATSLVGGAASVMANDGGLSDTPVNVSVVSGPAHASAFTLNADGSFSYTHDGSENFSDSFSYQLTDNDGQSSDATVSITISPVSDTTPVASDDAISVAEGGTATTLVGGAMNVKTNDTGLSDTPVNVSLVTDVSHGSLTLNADGTFSYVHDGSENFSDSFSYRLTDNDGQSSTATVSITISPVSDTTPVANADAIAVAEGGTATSLVGGATNVKTNDTGLTDTPVNVSLVTDVAHGTLTLNADGSFSYLHDGSENFSDSFSYRLTDNDGQTSDATVSITISPVSDATPVANADAISVAEGGTATSLLGGATNVKTNDTGLADSPVNVSLVSDVSHGTLTLNADGTFSYLHDGSENFSDSFSYRLTDNDGQTSDATVSITISPVSDTTPVAFDDAISVAEGGTATTLVGGATSVMANDGGLSDTPVNVSVVSGPAHASAFTLNADGSFSYTHDGSENFSDSFSYQLTDNDGQTSTATVSITISPVSDATPVANADAIAVAEGGTATSLVGGATNVKTNDTGLSDTPVNVSLVTDVSHGSLTLNADGSFSYVHDGSENFSDSFSYRLTDNDGETSTATVSITITPVSDTTPVANADAISVAEGGTATSLVGGATNVKTNDMGLSDTPVNVSLVSDVSHGTLTLNADGSFSYTHDGSENFSDSFSYRLTDNDGQVSEATVNITITPVSDNAPVITSSSHLTVTENTRTVLTVTSLDLDGDAPIYGIAGGADAARFTIDANTGVLGFLAAPDYENPSDFGGDNVYDVIVRVSDGTLSDTQAIAVTVTDIDESDIGPVQDRDGAPNAVVENAPSGTAVGITAVAVDPDGSAVSYSLDDNAGGRFSIDPDSGVVMVADGSLLDYESMAAHTIVVRATSTDGSFSTQSFTNALDDANEFAIGGVTDVNVASNAVDELSPAGTLIGVTAFASDADGSNHAVTYSLDDDAGGVFAIDPASGIITVAQGSSLGYATGQSPTITVRATSADGSFSTLTMAVEISRVGRNVIGTDLLPAGGGDMPGAGAADGSSGTAGGGVAGTEIARPSGDSKGVPSAAFSLEQSATTQRQTDGWILVADRQPDLPEALGRHAPVVAAPTPDRGTRIEMVELNEQDDGILRLLSLMQTNQRTGASPQALEEIELAVEHEAEQVGNDGGLDIQVDAVRVNGLTLTVGVVWWALRISGLAAGVAASLPFWRQIDVLSILPDSETDQPRWGEDADSEARREESAVAEVFGASR